MCIKVKIKSTWAHPKIDVCWSLGEFNLMSGRAKTNIETNQQARDVTTVRSGASDQQWGNLKAWVSEGITRRNWRPSNQCVNRQSTLVQRRRLAWRPSNQCVNRQRGWTEVSERSLQVFIYLQRVAMHVEQSILLRKVNVLPSSIGFYTMMSWWVRAPSWGQGRLL